MERGVDEERQGPGFVSLPLSLSLFLSFQGAKPSSGQRPSSD